MKKGISFITNLLTACWSLAIVPVASGYPLSTCSSTVLPEYPATLRPEPYHSCIGRPHAEVFQKDSLLIGPDELCPGSLQQFCTPEVPGAKYNWNISGDAVITDSADKFCTQVNAHFVCDGSFTIRLRIEAPGLDTTIEKTVVVQDKAAPDTFCPKDITVSCDEQLPTPDPSAMTVSDNCNGVVKREFIGGVTYDKICLNRYKVTRTYTATDACGNVATCTQHLEVSDELSPYITCPPNLTVSCPDPALTPDPFYVFAADNCGFVTLKAHESDQVSGPTQPNWYRITRTYRAEDNCGNTQTCTQRLDVFDPAAPTIVCPPDQTVSCASQVPVASPGNAQTDDNCGAAFLNTTVSDVISDQVCASQYRLTRTFRVTDAAGHTASCVQQYRVHDQTPPAIICPPNTTLNCGDEALEADLNAVTVSDNCGAYTKSVLKEEVANKICENNFTLTRTFKVEDDCGRSATCSVKIRVQNQTTANVVCPPNITVSCATEVPPANPVNASVSDYCGNTLNNVSWLGDLVTNKTCANRYVIARSYRATDACGVTGNCVQKITVNDQTAPVLTCLPNITVSCTAQVPLAAPSDVTVTDNCGGGQMGIYVADAIGDNTCNNRSVITRTYRSKDVCGNEGTCVRLITVDDQTPPAIKCPPNITVTCSSLVPLPNPALVTGTDNCSGSITKLLAGEVISDQTCSNQYLLTRTYQGVDICGNAGVCTQNITVSDTKAPTMVSCPANITVSDEKAIPPVNPGAIAASGENCGGDILKLHVADLVSDRACAGNYMLNRVYSAADDCGNSRTCEQKISVNGCFCTHPQDFWGDPAAKIGSLSVTNVIDSLLLQGGINIGNSPDCGLTLNTAACVLNLLPAEGPSIPFDASNLPLCGESLDNTLAGQVAALQLNIRFNTVFRGMNLGQMRLADVCAFDAALLATLGLPPDATIQDLAVQANAYLAAKCTDMPFPAQYGDNLAAGIAVLNDFWNHCQNNESCQPGDLNEDGSAERAPDGAITTTTGNLSLSPNPVASTLQVRFTDQVNAVQLQVFDRQGKLVFNRMVSGTATLEIDVNRWSPGVYWLTVTGDHGIETQRFVVSR